MKILLQVLENVFATGWLCCGIASGSLVWERNDSEGLEGVLTPVLPNLTRAQKTPIAVCLCAVGCGSVSLSKCDFEPFWRHRPPQLSLCTAHFRWTSVKCTQIDKLTNIECDWPLYNINVPLTEMKTFHLWVKTLSSSQGRFSNEFFCKNSLWQVT